MEKLKEKIKTIKYARIKSAIDKWFLQNQEELHVMVFGKTGVGKSTLLNSLFGQELFKTGNIEAVTHRIEQKDYIIEDVTVHFYDTPGLFDDENNDNKYLEEINKYIPKMDIILFCIDISDSRFRKEDFTLMSYLNKSSNINIWNKIIFVATCANKIDKVTLNKKIEILNDKIRKTVNKCVPIVCAGKDDHIIFENDWYLELWTKIFTVVDNQSQASVLKITVDRTYEEILNNKKALDEIVTKINSNPNAPAELKSSEKKWWCHIL